MAFFTSSTSVLLTVAVGPILWVMPATTMPAFWAALSIVGLFTPPSVQGRPGTYPPACP